MIDTVPTDTDLIQKIITQDRHALLVFYRTYTPKLKRFLQTKIHTPQDQDEILQDTLFAFLEAIRDFQGKSSIQTFLFSICHHKIIDFYRRKKFRHVVFSQVPFLESLLSPLVTPEEALDQKMVQEKITSVMARLVPHYRQVLQLKYVEQESVPDIAKKLAISIKSAESYLFRARKAFVQLFISI